MSCTSQVVQCTLIKGSRVIPVLLGRFVEWRMFVLTAGKLGHNYSS